MRKNRRIKRLDDNDSKERYVLKHHSTDSEGDFDFTGDDAGNAAASELSSNSLVGSAWNAELKERERVQAKIRDSQWENYRECTGPHCNYNPTQAEKVLNVGLDFTNCECQNEGDSHLTYGSAEDDGDDDEEFRTVMVGASGQQRALTRSEITLQGKYKFSCNEITDATSTFIDKSEDDCMDICRATVQALRTIPEMMELEENLTYNPFYIAMAVIVPTFFLLCLVCQLDNDGAWAIFNPAFVLTCKVFDWMSDWAFYTISLHNPMFTERSSMGITGSYHHVQKASLAFCIIGTMLVVAEWYGIGFISENASLCGMNNHHIRRTIGIFVIIFEDIPQLVLCALYITSMGDNQWDSVTGLSIILSSISFVYNVVTVGRQHFKGVRKDNGESKYAGGHAYRI